MRIDEFSNAGSIDGNISITEQSRFLLFGFDPILTLASIYRETINLKSVIESTLSLDSLVFTTLTADSSIFTTLTEDSLIGGSCG